MNQLYSDIPPVNVGGKTIVGRLAFAVLLVIAAVVGALAGSLLVYSTDLPQIGELERYRPAAITELYDDQGRVIGSFALQRRIIANYDDFPPVLRDAVLSIEDKDFEKHWGIDVQRAFGALYADLRSGRAQQGASTLTMQLARNLFLSTDRTASRKIQEIMLSIQIERRFTKHQIFAMYGNQIYLGHGVYGFAAGSQYYFNKPMKDLTLEEAALLAALPKSGIVYSPIANPQNALKRRNLVLNALLEDGKITAEKAAEAKAKPIELNIRPADNSVAPYFVEEVRQYLEKKYGSEEVHQNGLRVYTTLNLDWQRAANKAAMDGLAAYEHRHGWKGRLRNVLREGMELKDYRHPDWNDPIADGSYVHAVVTEVDGKSATVRFAKRNATLTSADITWTRAKNPADILKVGDIVWLRIVTMQPMKVTLEQDSGVQVALMAVDNSSGEIKAMIGGRNFEESKFNRATQAMRQVGSSFKPYVYTAALDEGVISMDDTILDAPTVFNTSGGPYAPSNYDGKFWGTLPLRVAVANSRNIPALKVAERVGIKTVIEYAHRFGLTGNFQPYLPVALGAGEVTLFEQVAAFTTFPNDGVRVTPRYIKKVADYDGHVREEDFVEVKDVISQHTARMMTSLLTGVVQAGTAVKAKKLNHALGGKTGTTNDFTDAWFVGFSPSITAGVWIGFDEKKTLGPKETGGEAALPIWIDFMKVALQGRDKEAFAPLEDETKPSPSNPQLKTKVAETPHSPAPTPSSTTAPQQPAVPASGAKTGH